MSHKIVVFGDLPIATKVSQWILGQDDMVLAGVVIGNENPNNNDPWPDTPLLADFAEENGVDRIILSEIPDRFAEGELDLGLLCRFSKIIKQDVIDAFRLGVINMHGGLLPEFAGLYSCNHEILCASPIGGGTLHYVDAGIDSGDVLARLEFPIEECDTGYSVFQKTQIVLYEGMISLIPDVLTGKAVGVPLSNYAAAGRPQRYFNARSLEGEKTVDFKAMTDEEIARRVRAFDFPGHEPAYVFVDGRKVYLRMASDER